LPDRWGANSERAGVGYPDRPKPRADDWTGRVCGTDARLDRESGGSGAGADDGGLEQQRHLGIEEQVARAEAPKQLELPDIDRDDPDGAADKRVMDRARAALV